MPSPITYFEVCGPDAAALRTFYASVFDWTIDAAGITQESTGGVRGGFRQDPAETLLYLAVPSIEATLSQVQAAGGATVMPRTVIPGVVTFAVFTDPAGNRMGLVERG